MTKDVHVVPGERLGAAPAQAAAALSLLRGAPLPGGVVVVEAGAKELTLVLASGFQLRLGDGGDLRLKLAIAARILPLATGGSYIDVSVPERPVASADSQVASQG